MKNQFYLILALLTLCMPLTAQKGEKQIVQFSGFVLAADSMIGVPFAHIGVKGTTRYGASRADGFFSFAVAEGDTLIFTSIGYYQNTYIVPFGNEDNKISTIVSLNKRDYQMRDVVVYPWGSRDRFHDYFVHVKIPRQLDDLARANTDRQLLAAIGASLPVDGGEATQRYIQYQAAQSYYYGQQAPQNIFNPLAWADFIKAIRNGDFKQKPAPTAPAPQNDY